MINITNKNGDVEVKKIIFKPGSESKEVLENPLLETIYNKKKFDEEKANKILFYYINIDNRFDLDNYLQYKMINLMDFVRAFYYKVMLITGIADTYRNEQYISKPDFLYDLDRLMLIANLNSMNREMVGDNIAIMTLYSILNWYSLLKDSGVIDFFKYIKSSIKSIFSFENQKK